jgi:hypothetical protein
MSMLSPRFLALPVIALAVIAALASASTRTQATNTQVASPTTVRAVSCATPAGRTDPACVIVRDDSRVVR